MKIETSIRLNYNESELMKELRYKFHSIAFGKFDYFTMKYCDYSPYNRGFTYCDVRCEKCIRNGKFEIICKMDDSKINLLDYIDI